MKERRKTQTRRVVTPSANMRTGGGEHAALYFALAKMELPPK